MIKKSLVRGSLLALVVVALCCVPAVASLFGTSLYSFTGMLVAVDINNITVVDQSSATVIHARVPHSVVLDNSIKPGIKVEIEISDAGNGAWDLVTIKQIAD